MLVMNNKSILGGLVLCLSISGCGDGDSLSGSGAGGMPTSLAEHVDMACAVLWDGILTDLENTPAGQAKDMKAAQIASLSDESLCQCTHAAVNLGRFSAVDADDIELQSGFEGDYNVLMGEYSREASLQDMYDLFRQYSLEETLPNIQTQFTFVDQDISRDYYACIAGLDPSADYIRQRDY